MIKNLQALRFVFSFTILVSHLLGHKYSTFGLGEYGVDGFFVLSGFVLSVAYGHKIDKSLFSTRYFFIKQWLKLYPLHIFLYLVDFYRVYFRRKPLWNLDLLIYILFLDLFPLNSKVCIELHILCFLKNYCYYSEYYSFFNFFLV